jgi:ABC-type transport system involved in multi-copper enzyme maturation permease subunit
VLLYPQVMKLMPSVPPADEGSAIVRQIREAAELMRSYRGYIVAQWFRQNLPQLWTIMAALLGSGGMLTQGAALFTLSLPVSRAQLSGVRALVGLAELLALAIGPTLLIPLLSPAVGESYAVGEALMHAVCLFTAGTVFFSLAFLLSTAFADVWRPLLLSLAVAVALASAEALFHQMSIHGIFGLMSGDTYFRTGALPWLGLVASAAASAAMLWLATISISRRDF